MPRIDTIVNLATGLDVAPAALLSGITWTLGTPETFTPGAFSIGEGE